MCVSYHASAVLCIFFCAQALANYTFFLVFTIHMLLLFALYVGALFISAYLWYLTGRHGYGTLPPRLMTRPLALFLISGFCWSGGDFTLSYIWTPLDWAEFLEMHICFLSLGFAHLYLGGSAPLACLVFLLTWSLILRVWDGWLHIITIHVFDVFTSNLSYCCLASGLCTVYYLSVDYPRPARALVRPLAHRVGRMVGFTAVFGLSALALALLICGSWGSVAAVTVCFCTVLTLGLVRFLPPLVPSFLCLGWSWGGLLVFSLFGAFARYAHLLALGGFLLLFSLVL
jgi:hypothetical protein